MERIHYKNAEYQVTSVARNIYEAYALECAKRNRVVADEAAVYDTCNKAARWLVSPTTRPWLFVLGRIGTGKTTLLQALRRVQAKMPVIRAGKKVSDAWGGAVVSALDLPRYATDESKQYDYRMITTGGDRYAFLYLDDVGQEPLEVKSYGNALAPFVEIVNKRYVSLLPLIVTSNLGLAEFAKTYGDRVLDRIQEMAEVVYFKGESYRRRAEFQNANNTDRR